MNYVGGKYKLLEQIEPLFPKKINRMADLFCGGLDVTLNTDAKEHWCNDVNYHLIEIYRALRNWGADDALFRIDSTIKTFGLERGNKETYYRFRDHYNKTKRPIDLFILLCFCFNSQLRFNEKHEFNSSFSATNSLTDARRDNLVKIIPLLSGIHFTSMEFQRFDFGMLKPGDFVYADPPYLIANPTYNDGKRGFTGWDEHLESLLYETLDGLTKRGIAFAVSNVLEHKDNRNEILDKWVRDNGYTLHHLHIDYGHASYNIKKPKCFTDEVLVTNY